MTMTDTATPLLEEPGSTLMDPQALVDTYADRLMDELFSPVENALAGDEAALASLRQPLIAPEPEPEPEVELAPPLPVAPAIAAVEELTTPVVVPPRRPWWQSGAGLAAMGTGLAVALGLLVWWQWRQVTPEPAVVPPVATEGPNPDAEFLAYLRRSLEVISQAPSEEEPSPGLVQDIPVTLDGNLNGAIAGFGTALEGASGPPQINVIERIYIPYQLEAPAATVTPPAPPTDPPSAPTAQVPPPTLPPVLPPSAAPAPATVVQTLVGILELGERSAALFEIGGVPQRVYIGERIGGSGWSLVSVGEGEAVIRRNGEVRSISIGQRF